MREIGEIELAIQGGTEKIESLGKDVSAPLSHRLFHAYVTVYSQARLER